jgi:pyruvate/2-oxoglutarate dehydrogenase complex dihydrolipoamide acyltransferase (E2) component
MTLQFSDPVDGKYHGEALVLSDTVLHNKKLGLFAIDLPTLVYHKERVTVDYNHDPNIILGYAENFQITDEGLTADVYLFESIAKVHEIIALIKGGTPFEISPAINEEEGTSKKEGNGITRFTHVPMRGVAVCPFGTDRYTTLTLLKEDLMSQKQQTKTTNLSDTAPTGESETPKVKDPDLAEFCDVYGREKGLDLWQSGADIADIRTLKELIEKYGVPSPPEPQPTELNDTPAEPKTETKEEPKAEPKKDETVTELHAVVTALKAEVTKLHAALPRGEQTPVSHNYQNDTQESQKELSEKEKYLAGFNKSLAKK